MSSLRLTAAALLLASFACARHSPRPAGARPGSTTATAIDALVAEGFRSLRGRRLGIVTNPTAVDHRFRHLVDLIADSGSGEIVALFGPEHGIRGSAQAGESVGRGVDPRTGAPVYSLYGEVRRPTAAMLAGVDLLLFDMQDVGVRTYTYLSTLLECLRAAAAHGIEVWVLDRPNPLGRAVEGPVLEATHLSFVGPHTIPLRHGLTVGEFARMANEEQEIGARLRVLPCSAWDDELARTPTPGRWVAPSPNIPTPSSALHYAGFVLIEGTNLSEGRGTTRPFQLVGAPWLDADRLAPALEARRLPGVHFRPASFRPTFSKHEGELCRGVEAHVVDRDRFRPVAAALAVISEVRRLHPDRFAFLDSFDRLAGTGELRGRLEEGADLAAIVAAWETPLELFRERRRRFLLYGGDGAAADGG